MAALDPSRAPVREGDILAGKYRVESILGMGGMGVVVAATHLVLGTRVAIKFLLDSTYERPEAAERFLREARAAARIEGEHVARVTDVAQLESGTPYMVMELLRGTDLAVHLKKNAPLAPDAVVEYVLQACEAIAEAHQMGIVHRDLKPSNLFLTRRPDGSPLVKVLDFGISKALDTARASLIPGGLTGPDASFGSPLYMSPEQIESSSQVDHRTDIWALGVVLHELLAGRPPFVRDKLPALYVAIATEPATPLRALRPEIPEALERAVLRCLEKDPKRRTQSVADLALALEPVAPASAAVSIARIVRLSGVQSSLATTSSPPSRVDESAPTQLDPKAHSDRSAGSGGKAQGEPVGASSDARAWGSTASARKRRTYPVVLSGVAVAFAVAAVMLLRGAPTKTRPPVAAPPSAESVVVTVKEAPSATASVAPPPPPAPADASVVSDPVPERPPSRPAPQRAPVAPQRDTKKGSSAPPSDGLDDRN